jgi:bacterioferritin
MAATDTIVDVLTQLLADELRAASQYSLHAELCAGWGRKRQQLLLENESRDEILHARWLLGRIVSLGAPPRLVSLAGIHIAGTIEEIFDSSFDAESWAIAAYDEAIAASEAVNDLETRDLLRRIAAMEQAHLALARRESGGATDRER